MTAFIEPKSCQQFTMKVTPKHEGRIVIDTIRISVNGMHDFVKLPEAISVTAVDSPVVFFTRTNLPLTTPLELYIGQRFTFDLWVTNNGSSEITEIKVTSNSKNAFSVKQHKLVALKPRRDVRFTCSCDISEICDSLDFEIACSSEKSSEIESVIEYSQPLLVRESVIPVSVVALDTFSAASESVLIAMMFRNVADEAFSYTFSCNEPVQNDDRVYGLIGKSKTKLLELLF
jgi:hypothetical protein